MLEVTEIEVVEINLFVQSQEFAMLCMILEILVKFHNEAIAVDPSQDLNSFTSSLDFFINVYSMYEIIDCTRGNINNLYDHLPVIIYMIFQIRRISFSVSFLF